MKGAIFFASKYGSTAQYADWIAEQTGLPAFDITASGADASHYDFLVIGSPVLYYHFPINKWVEKNLIQLLNRPVIFFSVSGARAGPKLDQWMTHNLPASFVSHCRHVALGGKMRIQELKLIDKIAIKFAAFRNKNDEAKKQEFEGFDFMDQSSIAPIVDWVEKIQSKNNLGAQQRR